MTLVGCFGLKWFSSKQKRFNLLEIYCIILLKYLSTIQGICSFRKNTASHSIYEKKRNNKSICPVTSDTSTMYFHFNDKYQ